MTPILNYKSACSALAAAVFFILPASAPASETVLHIGTETEADVVTCREPIHAKMMANAVPTGSTRFSAADQNTMAWLIDTRKCSVRQPVVFVPKKPLQLGPPHVLEAFAPVRHETVFVITSARIMRDDVVIAENAD
ncbi:MAG: hypothetical protein HKN60_01620 [Rhizobiales bacterium]|nr:hypothetical protein [Hyphomicrobiales bacterium]